MTTEQAIEEAASKVLCTPIVGVSSSSLKRQYAAIITAAVAKAVEPLRAFAEKVLRGEYGPRAIHPDVMSAITVIDNELRKGASEALNQEPPCQK